MKTKTLVVGDRVRIVDRSHPYYDEIGYIARFGTRADVAGRPVVRLPEVGDHEVYVLKDGGVKKV